MAKLHSRFIKDKRLQRFDLCCLNYDEYMMLKRLVRHLVIPNCLVVLLSFAQFIVRSPLMNLI